MLNRFKGKAMIKALQRYADDKEEYTKALWLFGYLFCVVSASTVGRTSADALFLSRFDASELSVMYLPQSVSLIVIGVLFQKFSGRFRLDRLIQVLIPVISLLVLVSRMGVGLGYDWVLPVIYIGYDVFNFLMIVVFWQFATAVMDQRKVKRMIGLVGSGGLVGGIISGFGLKLIVPVVGTANLIYFYAALQMLALLAVYRLIKLGADPKETFASAPAGSKKPVKERQKQEEPKGGLFHNVPHLKYVAVMFAALVLSLTFIDYQFKVILRNTLQNEALAGFMGSFYGYSGLLALFFQLFISGTLLTRFGVMTAILVFPVALFAGSLGVLLMPVLALAVIVKGSDKVLGDTIHSSVSQLIMFPIAPSWRNKAKSFLDGVVRNGAKGAAGISLMILSPLLTAGQFSYLILGLLVCCVAAAIQVKKAYLQTLLSSLETRGTDLQETELDFMDPASRDILSAALRGSDKQQILYVLKILRGLDSFDLTPYIPALLKSPYPEVCIETIAYIEQKVPAGLDKELRQLLDSGHPKIQAQALLALAAYFQDDDLETITARLEAEEVEIQAGAIAGLIKFYGIEGMFRAVGTLKQLMESGVDEERQAMAVLFGRIGIRSFYKPLIPMLQDTSPPVRRSALESAASLRVPELVPQIALMLRDSQTRRHAIEALAAYDEKLIIGLLTPCFQQAGKDWLHLPKVFERIGTQEAFDALLAQYTLSDYEMRDKLAEALRNLRPGIRQVNEKLLEELILDEIRLYAQFAEHGAAVTGADGKAAAVSEAIAQLRSSMTERIFGLLGLIYDAKTVQAVYIGWSEGDARQQANAAEVMDQLLQGHLRLEVNKLMTSPRTIQGGRMQGISGEDELGWLYEHGDEWLRRMIRYETGSQYRLGSREGMKLGFSTDGSSGMEEPDVQMNRVRWLKNISLFQGLKDRDLFQIAALLKPVYVPAGGMVFQLRDPGDSLYIIESGQAGVYRNREQVSVLQAGACLGQTALLTQKARTATVRAATDLQLWRLDSAAFYELMFDRTGIAMEMMKLLSRRLRSMLESSAQRLEADSEHESVETVPSPSSQSEAAASVESVHTASTADTAANNKLLRRVLILQKIELFSHLAQDDYIRLAQMVDEVEYEAGEAICRVDEFGDAMFGIIEGNVRVHRGGETFANLGEGEYFGEMAIIDSGLRSADCTAVEHTVLLQLQRDQVFSFCFQNIDVLRSMMQVLADRVKGMIHEDVSR
ncbi:Npt1/Npt2 family nucleotide transporter [Paenibacillus sp. H1-7]|uniref:Npt1/Npt2 family nucleotide transporter n=1 Tax=Paenibacillus sp. H1-7 TaxID=2282849 RepID=UPI001EF8B6E2|nr:Npt1/Npt2 family nucleotide transporter [Paenibacillus sp. H1-7]